MSLTTRWLKVAKDGRSRAYALTDHATGVTHLRFAPPNVVSYVYEPIPIGALVRHGKTLGRGVRGDPMRHVSVVGVVVARWVRRPRVGKPIEVICMRTDDGCRVISSANTFHHANEKNQKVTRLIHGYGDGMSPRDHDEPVPPPSPPRSA